MRGQINAQQENGIRMCEVLSLLERLYSRA